MQAPHRRTSAHVANLRPAARLLSSHPPSESRAPHTTSHHFTSGHPHRVRQNQPTASHSLPDNSTCQPVLRRTPPNPGHRPPRMGGGSSHKRRNKPRRTGNNGGRQSTEPLTHRVLNFEDHTINSGFGFDLMSRFGWTAGEPLGSRNDSTAELSASRSESPSALPIPIIVRQGRAGLGARPIVIAGAADPPSGPMLSSSPASPDSNESTFVSRAATMAVFDPLRPRCRYDHSHVVATLKALHKHEKKCGANPNRAKHAGVSARVAAGGGHIVQEWLMNNAALVDDEEEGSVLSDEDSIMSALSSLSAHSDSDSDS